ncbi:MAG: DNA primase [Dissulfurispiraceae bacterium]|jgi:DNA primase
MQSDGLIDEIKSRIDIHDLIAEYVDLKRAGQNYKGLCPFHSEKTPSFMVNPAKQIFHCFGCNKGGDIFSFIMNYENMPFNEALSFLAGKAGVQIDASHGSGANKGIKESLFAIHEEALKFYRSNLKEAKHVLSYLRERDINPETIEQFTLGYAKGERDALLRHLRNAGFSEAHLKASGLAYFGGDGAHDFFRDRLIFPIFDLRSKVVAFGGRTLSSSKNIPKYLNSPENPIFRKSESCYALNTAKSHIAQKGYAIIVEGYFDVIVCHQFGFLNTVAPLGTALTAGHLRRLKKLSNKILLTFDADAAGIAAAKRTIEQIYSEGMISKIVLLSEGEDPDTFLRKYGADHFRKFLAKAASPVQFFLSRAGSSKIDGVRQFLSILSSCRDQLLRDDALRELSDLASEKILRTELANMSHKAAGLIRHADAGFAPSLSEKSAASDLPSISKEEEILLNLCLSFPRMAHRIAERIDASNLDHPLAKRVFAAILALHIDEELTAEKIMAVCSPEERIIISKSSIDPGIDMDEISQNIEGCIRKIAVKGIDKRIAAAKNEGNEKELSVLHCEKSRLLQKPVELFQSKKSK